MSNDLGNQIPPARSPSAPDGNLGPLFFDGLPTMTAIVALVAQPFAQKRRGPAPALRP